MNIDQPQMNTEDTDQDRDRDPLTGRIIGAAYAVHNSLGVGFLEKVYENALTHELRKQGFQVHQQQAIHVHYDNIVVGEYFADLIVDQQVLIELKAVKAFDNAHVAQCINYLRATRLKTALLLNFGTTNLGIKRISN